MQTRNASSNASASLGVRTDANDRVPEIIVTGTDPKSRSGGIGIVLPAYLGAIEGAGYHCVSIPTYHPARSGGKVLLWLTSIPRILRAIQLSRRGGIIPIVYSHAGAAPSILREALILGLARLAGARTVMHLHASHWDEYIERRRFVSFLRRLLSSANAICVLTEWWKFRLTGARIHHRIVVIPNPLLSELELIAATPFLRSIPKIGSVSVLCMTRLVEGKGIHTAIRALQFLPERVTLVIAGDGPLKQDLEQLAKTLAVSKRVAFHGWVSGERKKALLEQAHVFCLPSTKDAFPIAMVEAMAYGLPVVAVRWGGIPEVVPHNRAGLLTEAADPRQIAVAIMQLVDDPKGYGIMARESKLCALELCSPHLVGARLNELFSLLTGRNKHG